MLSAVLITLSLILLITLFAQHLLWVWRVSRMTANIPGPKPWPIIGNALLFAHSKTSEDKFNILKTIYLEYAKPNQNIYKIWYGTKVVITTGNPSHIDTILSSPEALNKDDFYKLFQLIADGVFVANGEKWKELRKPLNKMMHRNKIESSLGLFYAKSQILCEKLRKFAENGEIVNLRLPVTNCMVDAISVFSLGHDLNEQDEDQLKLTEHVENSFEKVLELYIQPPYCFLSPKLAKMTWKARQVVKKMTKVHLLFGELIDERSRSRKPEEDQNHEIYADQIDRIAKRDGLNQIDIGKLFFDLIIAGFDTTSVIMSSVLLMLAIHPEHQEAVYREQVEMVGADPDVAPTWQQLTNMDYLTRVMKEAMRLFCPIGILRKLSNDVDLGDYTLPKHSTVYIHLHELHRRPEFWSHPEEFYPDHFLPEAVASRPKAAYLPFSWGPRRCPGGLFAMYAARTILSTLVRTYRLETELRYDELKYKYGLLTEVQQGYPVRLFARDTTTHT